LSLLRKIVLKAADLDGYLTDSDRRNLLDLDKTYRRALRLFRQYVQVEGAGEARETRDALIALYTELGDRMQTITDREPRIRVYPWQTPPQSHGEVSRLIAKLRDVHTGQYEFVYYIQRAFELLFNLAYGGLGSGKRNHLIVRTPINLPVQNYAVHKIPFIDENIENTVVCVMLRGALLPSMIVSKEIQEYSSNGYVTPFALFKVSRDDKKTEREMEYTLDLERSYFKLESLHGKDLIFADPMNATGGSLVTIVTYLLSNGVEPKSIFFLNVISALKGCLRIVRALEQATVYTLWLDPVLNTMAYILPGLGDAGDRINGPDIEGMPRDIIALIAAYGATITSLYRSQVREIEATVLGRHQ